MLTRIVMSVCVILTCMAAMSITAYAFFSYTITTGVTELQAASWKIAVLAEPDVAQSGNSYTMDNQAGTQERVYQFTVAKDPTATASHGYVKIDVKTDVDDYAGVQTYYSQPIGKILVNDSLTEEPDRIVKITVPAGKIAYVSFTAEWGSCSKQPIVEESAGILPLFGAGVSVEETTEPETTVPETTEPESTEEMTEPETTEEATQPETTVEETTEETTATVTEPESTEETTEAETTEPETTEIAVVQETTVPEE